MLYPPADPPMVYSHLAGREVSTWSEEWKHECEVAYLAAMTPAKLTEMMDGVPGATDRDQRGIKVIRTVAAADHLREEIKRYRAAVA